MAFLCLLKGKAAPGAIADFHLFTISAYLFGWTFVESDLVFDSLLDSLFLRLVVFWLNISPFSGLLFSFVELVIFLFSCFFVVHSVVFRLR